MVLEVLSMNIVAIIGSRSRRGQTARAAEALCMGAAGAGAKWDSVFLPELDMRRCKQCDADGWGRCMRKGLCVMEEDRFASVTERLREADAAIIATPVYFSDLSESLRAYLDRLRRICSHPEARADRLADKPVIGVCVAGGSGGGACRCTVALERVLLDCGLDVVDMIPARRQNLAAKLPLLKGVGRWLTTQAPADRQ